MTRKTKVFSAILLSLILCLSGLVTAAMAQEPPEPTADPNATQGIYAKPAQGGLTKLLKVPVGTVIPTLDFYFNVTPISVDGDASKTGSMPEIGANNVVTISFADGTTAEADDDGIMNLYQESGDLFETLIGTTAWPHTGIFVYEIAEDTARSGIDENTPHEYATYSPARYKVNVYVLQDNATGEYYVKAIGALVVAADIAGQETNIKVDPTPGIATAQSHSKMIFTNTYVKTNGPEDPKNPLHDDKTTLAISKAVDGEFSSNSVYFRFNLTLTAPAVPSQDSGNYRAYVIENDAFVKKNVLSNTAMNNVDPLSISQDAKGNDYIPFTSASQPSFSLKHGQKLVFFDTPVGTRYSVTEEAATAYEPSYKIYRGTLPSPIGSGSADISASLSTGDLRIDEEGNTVAYTNNRDMVTPTGLNLNDLPFIIMIALALLGTAGYIVVKSRKTKGCN